MALTDKLTAIADGFRESRGTTNTYTLDDMATLAAEPIEQTVIEADGVPEEAFTLSGNQGYAFYHGAWDWFIKNYGDIITTKDLTSTYYMFADSDVEEIPFDLNLSSNGVDISNMFEGMSNVKTIGTLKGGRIMGAIALFKSCDNLRELPNFEDSDWSLLA